MSFDAQRAELDHLVLVAGHAVLVAEDLCAPEADASWSLASYQAGEAPFYIEHVRRGVELAAASEQALLVFSGGQTKREAGPRSEAESCLRIARHYDWWGSAAVAARSTTEDFARDSYENLLFGIACFRSCTGRYPRAIDVVSWAFKEERFQRHRRAICYPEERFVYHGTGEPHDLESARAGELATLALFDKDPHGTESVLSAKREERDPFGRTPPYAESCPEIVAVLRHRTRDGELHFDWTPLLEE